MLARSGKPHHFPEAMEAAQSVGEFCCVKSMIFLIFECIASCSSTLHTQYSSPGGMMLQDWADSNPAHLPDDTCQWYFWLLQNVAVRHSAKC